MRITESHVYFWGSYLSNFWLCKLEINVGNQKFKWISSEHAYMAFKALNFGDSESFHLIHGAPDAKSAKAIGRKIANFDAEKWDKVSYEYMFIACYAKFSQNEDLKGKLLSTGNKTLVEASPIDKIWGVGLHEDDDLILDEKNWTGQNRLGLVLMDVRNQLD